MIIMVFLFIAIMKKRELKVKSTCSYCEPFVLGFKPSRDFLCEVMLESIDSCFGFEDELKRCEDLARIGFCPFLNDCLKRYFRAYGGFVQLSLF